MMDKKMQLSAMCLLLLHVAHSEVCSDGVCGANDLKQLASLDDAQMGESKELSMVQLSAIEKRAQEEEDGSAQALDAAVTKKGKSSESVPEARQKQSLNSKDSKDQALHDTDSKGKSSKDKASKEKSSKEKSSKDKASKDKSAKEKISKEAAEKIKKIQKMAEADPWTEMGDGCCAGERDSHNGKLFGLNVSSLDECKAQCRSFHNCAIVEYGWKDMPQWCYGWGNRQACKTRDAKCKLSVPGNGKGVKGYKFTAPKIDERDAAEFSWDIVGPGCCDAVRDEKNGKLYGSKEPNLEACKAKCLTFPNCGIIEYGWLTGDPEWCFIWDDKQKCEKQDMQCSKSAMGGGFGAKAHKLIRAEE